MKAYALASLGRGDEARALCRVLEQEFSEGRASGMYLSSALTILGEPDLALQILERGFNRRDQFIPWLLVQPAYDPLRNLPGFPRLLAEARLGPIAEIEPVAPIG